MQSSNAPKKFYLIIAAAQVASKRVVDKKYLILRPACLIYIFFPQRIFEGEINVNLFSHLIYFIYIKLFEVLQQHVKMKNYICFQFLFIPEEGHFSLSIYCMLYLQAMPFWRN